MPDPLEAQPVPHVSAARVLMNLRGEGAEEAPGRMERHRKAISAALPLLGQREERGRWKCHLLGMKYGLA